MSTHLEASRLWNIDECHRGRTSSWSSSLYPPPEVATFSYVLVKCISRKPSAFPKLKPIHDAAEGLFASSLVVEWSSPAAFLLTTVYPMNIFLLGCFFVSLDYVGIGASEAIACLRCCILPLRTAVGGSPKQSPFFGRRQRWPYPRAAQRW